MDGICSPWEALVLSWTASEDVISWVHKHSIPFLSHHSTPVEIVLGGKNELWSLCLHWSWRRCLRLFWPFCLALIFITGLTSKPLEQNQARVRLHGRSWHSLAGLHGGVSPPTFLSPPISSIPSPCCWPEGSWFFFFCYETELFKDNYLFFYKTTFHFSDHKSNPDIRYLGFFIYYFERKRARVGRAEREGERESQVGSTLPEQGPMRSSNSRTVRS